MVFISAAIAELEDAINVKPIKEWEALVIFSSPGSWQKRIDTQNPMRVSYGFKSHWWLINVLLLIENILQLSNGGNAKAEGHSKGMQEAKS